MKRDKTNVPPHHVGIMKAMKLQVYEKLKIVKTPNFITFIT